MKNMHNMARDEIPPEVFDPNITIRTQHKITKKVRPIYFENTSTPDAERTPSESLKEIKVATLDDEKKTREFGVAF